MKQILQHLFCQRKSFWIAMLSVFIMGNLLATVSNAKEISDKFVRFHIVANSNCEEDQAVKWNIREEIFSALDLSTIQSKSDALQYFQAHQEEIEKIANTILEQQGFDYQCKVSVGKREFPVREYSDFVLPAGIYDSVCITLGEGKGENFFCVMYPSLCLLEGIVESSSNNAEVIQHVLTEKEASLICGNKTEVIYKFKIAELLGKIF